MLALFLAPVLLISSSAFADALQQNEKNTYFHCKHTHRKVERTKDCPCGCNKKRSYLPRFHDVDNDCESDDVAAHAPKFEKLVSVLVAAAAPVTEVYATSIRLHNPNLQSIFPTPNSPTG
jgi:hypothetical protein